MMPSYRGYDAIIASIINHDVWVTYTLSFSVGTLNQQPKSLRAGLGWCVVSVPLPSGTNTGSNSGGGQVLKKRKKLTVQSKLDYPQSSMGFGIEFFLG